MVDARKSKRPFSVLIHSLTPSGGMSAFHDSLRDPLLGIMFEDCGHSKAQKEATWDLFSSIVDDGQIPDSWTVLSIIYVALRIVFVGHGIWTLVGDLMLTDFEELRKEKLREQDTAVDGEKEP